MQWLREILGRFVLGVIITVSLVVAPFIPAWVGITEDRDHYQRVYYEELRKISWERHHMGRILRVVRAEKAKAEVDCKQYHEDQMQALKVILTSGTTELIRR